MATWLHDGPQWMNGAERQQWRETVRDVVANLDRYFPDDQADYLDQAGGDPVYSLWLRLVDEQLDQLPARGNGRPAFTWRQAYEAGWPPRETACTAWSGLGERPDVLDAVSLPIPATEPVVRGGDRPAMPGERCTCGRPAVVVFTTERFGVVGACRINDGGRGGPWPCIFCRGDESHERGDRCPAYRLRLEDDRGRV
jgi:hypothetical protein